MTNTNGEAATWFTQPYQSSDTYGSVNLTSQYLVMRDGVKIAIDLYLPKKIKNGTKLPAVLHQTRYYRRFVYNWVLRPYMLRRDNTYKEIMRFVKNGYAVINADVRGSGASFGTRYMEFCPDEVQDGAEIVDWIVEQPWSSGLVGTIGTSYTGSAAELLLTNHHPAMKAAVIRYANFDAYPDIIYPGGVRNRGFLKTWSEFDDALDNDRLSAFLRKKLGRVAGIAVRGMPAVDDDRSEKLKSAAVEQHRNNYDIYEASKGVEYRDDQTEDGISLDVLSPSTQLDKIADSNVPIYSWSGWYDGAFTHAAVKRFLNIKTAGSRLILGPWDHGGGQNPDTNIPGNESDFDHTGEVLRFFDLYLKGIETGIQEEEPARYFTMGENAWKSSDTWPPPGFQDTELYFHGSNLLEFDEVPQEVGVDAYQVDYATSTGLASRWVSLVNVTQVDIGYPDRVERDKKLLFYQSDPLEQDLELTGHPEVTLYIRSNESDAQLFVYLEDVTEEGSIHYVTEGQFRAIHRLTNESPAEYIDTAIHHTYRREDARMLVPGDTARVRFNLLPVSYLFKSGHSIRVAIAGADKGNFALVPAEPPLIEVLRGPEHPSHVLLPLQLR